MPNPTSKRSRGLTPEQKRLFRAALLYFGYTRETWAAHHHIGTGYLDHVRAGFATSDRVTGQILDTIAAFQRRVAEDYIAKHPEICRVA